MEKVTVTLRDSKHTRKLHVQVNICEYSSTVNQLQLILVLRRFILRPLALTPLAKLHHFSIRRSSFSFWYPVTSLSAI